MVQRFTGKVAIITGAGSGIGLATARRFVREGGQCVAVDLSAQRLQDLKAELASEGLNISIVAGDLTEDEVIEKVNVEAGERIDILINNAGIMDDFVPLDELDDELWERVMAVNVTSIMKLTRAVIKKMLIQGSGAIVTTSSGGSFKSGIAGTAYTTSKHAINGFVKSLSSIYGKRGIRSNAVAPGAVKTNIMAADRAPRGLTTMQLLMENMANNPGIAEPEEIASVILFLASDEASNINGTILSADGGWSAK